MQAHAPRFPDVCAAALGAGAGLTLAYGAGSFAEAIAAFVLRGYAAGQFAFFLC